MSILIRGMEMPTSCEKCPFLDYEEGFCFASGAGGKSGWYEFTLRPGTIKDRRHDDCPLVHVPPHGRLIGAAELQKDIHEHDYVLQDFFGTKDCGMFTLGIDYAIQSAPTIIPAEDGET